MANVSITSDLEPYLASLRTYLAQNNSTNGNNRHHRRSSSRSDDEDKKNDVLASSNAVQSPEVSGLRRESNMSNGDKRSSSSSSSSTSTSTSTGLSASPRANARYPVVEGGSRPGATAAATAGGRV